MVKKSFRNMRELKEYYFPKTTAKEREEEFVRTATPEQIGKHGAEESTVNLKKSLGCT